MTAVADFDVGTLLEDTNLRLVDEYVEAFRDLLVATVTRNAPQARAVRLRIQELAAEAMGKAEVLGALSVLQQAAKVYGDDERLGFRLDPDRARWTANRRQLLAFGDTAASRILTRVPFADAVEDLVDRAPAVIRPSAERIATQIADLYSDDRGVIAFARSAEEAVTERAQQLITQAIREGIPERDIGRTLAFDVNRIRKETAAWTESYARMAFRTNLNDAVTKGRMRMARDPDVKVAVPAFRYTAVGDRDTRPNHKAADGVILSVDNPAWRFMRPPFGYNCRCQLDHMTRPELERLGRIDRAGKVIESKIPHNARPDPGFRAGGRA